MMLVLATCVTVHRKSPHDFGFSINGVSMDCKHFAGLRRRCGWEGQARGSGAPDLSLLLGQQGGYIRAANRVVAAQMSAIMLSGRIDKWMLNAHEAEHHVILRRGSVIEPNLNRVVQIDFPIDAVTCDHEAQAGRAYWVGQQ